MDEKFNEICMIRVRDDRREGPQNDADIARACLIAAAPELLKMVETMQRMMGREQYDPNSDWADAVLAGSKLIAKAKGQA
jgi:hypothetical protein